MDGFFRLSPPLRVTSTTRAKSLTAAATQRLIRISFPVAACLTSAAVDPGPGPARERSQTDVHELRDGVGVVVILVCVGTA